MPGVRIRSFPSLSARLIVVAESVGLATKNRSIDSDVPAVAPPPHVVPTEACRSSGTKTRNAPLASTYRNGASRVTGLLGSVVYGCGPPDCAGVALKLCGGTAPVSPEKTWFQTPFDQLSMSLLRTRNCCCEPFSTELPVNCESAMKPPLEKLGFEQ